MFDVPYLVRILASLGLILVINKFTKNLIVSLAGGALVLALWCGHSMSGMSDIAWERLSSANNLFLLLVVFQVTWLSKQMAETGTMKALVQAVRSRVSQRNAMAILPAVIGLLPMPGGAIFSAPMVDDCDESKSIDPLLKTKINYWFRHIWEYWWPIYPAVLLAIELTGLPMWQFILMLLPMSILSVFAGWFFLLRRIESVPVKDDKKRDPASLNHILSLVSPILLIIGVYAAIRLSVPKDVGLNKYLPMAIGLVLAQVILQIQRPLKRRALLDIFLSKRSTALVVLVIAVRTYGAFVEARLPDGTLMMNHVNAELSSTGIPVVLVLMAIPFICGVTTGLAIAFVGASFPIVLAMIDTGNPTQLIATTILAYCFGYMGILMSPVHVCLIVTNKHFETGLGASLLRLLRPAAVVLCVATALYFAIMQWGPQ